MWHKKPGTGGKGQRSPVLPHVVRVRNMQTSRATSPRVHTLILSSVDSICSSDCVSGLSRILRDSRSDTACARIDRRVSVCTPNQGFAKISMVPQETETRQNRIGPMNHTFSQQGVQRLADEFIARARPKHQGSEIAHRTRQQPYTLSNERARNNTTANGAPHAHAIQQPPHYTPRRRSGPWPSAHACTG